MGWSIGWDSTWQRDIGYGVPALCDHPNCSAVIVFVLWLLLAIPVAISAYKREKRLKP